MTIKEIYYTVIGWLNYPSRSTAIDQINLRHMDNGILKNAQNIVALSQDKAEMSVVNLMVKSVELDVDTGILTVIQQNGTTKTYDLAIEQVVVNFDITDDNELILTLADGTQKKIDLTRFVYAVDSTATVAMKIVDRVITAEVIDGSITADKLEASIMETIRQYTFDAQAAAAEAAAHDENAEAAAAEAKEQAERAGWYADLILPGFEMDYDTGHLYCVQESRGVTIFMEDDHVIAEVA